jgi:sporulation protein YlmC with PRC-barrel domain
VGFQNKHATALVGKQQKNSCANPYNGPGPARNEWVHFTTLAWRLLRFGQGDKFMPSNGFEDSRVTQGTFNKNAQYPSSFQDDEDSKAISRDDVRDGAATRLRRVLSASTLAGDQVRNSAGEDLGKIEEIMIDIPSGRVAYAVLSFGGFLGIGDKLFAVPWSALTIDEGEHQFVLNVDRQTLEGAPGFDKDNWPDMGDPAFDIAVNGHFGTTAYYEHHTTEAGDYMGDNPRSDQSAEYEPSTTYTAGRH